MCTDRKGIHLVIKDLVYEAKAKAKAKDMKIFQGQHQGQLRQLPLRAKFCIAVTETEYAYLIKHNAKESICRFSCAMLKIIKK